MKGKIFNAQEVQAIIAGNKTMFREVIKVQPANENQVFSTVASSIRNKDIGTHNFINPKATWEQTKKFKRPYQVGQKIFCKEAWGRKATGSGIAYKADNPNQLIYQHLPVKWNLPQHMKKKHSRLTLEITDIKVERLKDISEEDAIKEGVFKSKDYWHSTLHPIKGTYQCWTSAKEAFGKLWNATHKKPEAKFEANPFVWVVDFKINK
jgi:hypothetical protein